MEIKRKIKSINTANSLYAGNRQECNSKDKISQKNHPLDSSAVEYVTIL